VIFVVLISFIFPICSIISIGTMGYVFRIGFSYDTREKCE